MAALLKAGFHVHHRGHGFALLKHRTKIVVVPAIDIVTPAMFEAIARSAGLTSMELEGLLPRLPRSSGTYTRPHVEQMELSPPSSANGGRRRRR